MERKRNENGKEEERKKRKGGMEKRQKKEGVSKIKLGADYADYTDLYFKFIPDHTLDK